MVRAVVISSSMCCVVLGLAGCGGTSDVRAKHLGGDAAVAGDGGRVVTDIDSFFTPTDGGNLGDIATVFLDAACATQTAKAQRLPLSLTIMLDASYSMGEEIAPNVTKWKAVTDALSSFLTAPASAGLNIALMFFPQIRASVPEECTSDGMCGNYGPCGGRMTCDGGNMVVLCDSSNDCPSRQNCVELGWCRQSGGYCIPTGARCLGGGPFNVCDPVPGYCDGRDRCELSAYQTPIASGTLPGSATTLTRALGGIAVDGLTPTAPALTGALSHAQSMANTQSSAAVVLATDGLPSSCDPVDIDSIAAIAQGGFAASPSIPTFVIGVFSSDEATIAQPNLNSIARMGGTAAAFIIRTNTDVTQQFLAALNEIRQTALPCEYEIPMPDQGTINYGQVNVQFTDGQGKAVTIGYVDDEASCDPRQGGWHYDEDPAKGGTPTKVSVCPTTCNLFNGITGGQVDVLFGCDTVRIIE